ncbi:hypothetical protein ACTXPS_12160 [Brachybacterium tyrofermentans]|uniref:hypothetical protein n=1 Tax=Brachybacterium tyrofermentans TaxID=47848 RepID=UPI003FD36D72
MIPNSNPNIRARFHERDRDDDGNFIGVGRFYSLPVIAWDRDGNAMVPGFAGRLATAYGYVEDRNTDLSGKTIFAFLEDDEHDLEVAP